MKENTKQQTNNNSANPFADYFKSFQDSNMFSNFQQPSFDMSSMVNNQKRTASMFANLNKVISDGMQTMMRNSVENFQRNSSEAFKMVKDGSQNIQNPEQHSAQTMQTTKTLCDRTLCDVRNTMEMMSKMNLEIFDEVCKNVSENLDDACKISKRHKA
jgi:hypothetical protein